MKTCHIFLKSCFVWLFWVFSVRPFCLSAWGVCPVWRFVPISKSSKRLNIFKVGFNQAQKTDIYFQNNKQAIFKTYLNLNLVFLYSIFANNKLQKRSSNDQDFYQLCHTLLSLQCHVIFMYVSKWYKIFNLTKVLTYRFVFGQKWIIQF